jgi:2-polyprenyl-3-methyl-5-hydroxy-6-metoxy-1,4-benzoquinol methylase
MNGELAVIVRSFEREVTAHLRELGEDPAAAAVQTTIATNSTLIEQRGRPLVELVCAELERTTLHGVRVLDLGCGYGALSALFATEGASVLGIDAEAERLEVGRRIAEAHGLAVTLRPGRMERPELPHAAFDVVLVNNSFCYVIDGDARRRILEEAYRAMHPGGLIVVRDPNRLHPRDQFTALPLIGLLPPRLANASAAALRRRRSVVRLRTPAGARRELEHAGFKRARIASPGGRLRRTFAGYYHVIARRPLS